MANLVKVLEASGMKDGSVRIVRAAGRSIAISRIGEEFFAMDNFCLHRGGPLGEGSLDGYEITCPWHGWTYDVRDGSFEVIPALKLKTYPVTRQGDSLMVDLDGRP
jgi:nitrite reductase (NADH) small subunit